MNAISSATRLLLIFFAMVLSACASLPAGAPAPSPAPSPTSPSTSATPPPASSPAPSSPGASANAAGGETKGTATRHTPVSQVGLITQAAIALPASLTGGNVFYGRWATIPSNLRTAKVPVVVFLHGSSGVNLKAIEEWQRWLATLGVASVAPDSFALADRLVYKSPIDKTTYEKIHALRNSEIGFALEALRNTPWADVNRLALAGTSEGAISVARYSGPGFQGRLMYAWSCEDNYYVTRHQTAIPASQPVLNVVSSTDPFFSASNPWVGLSNPVGHCGPVLAQHKSASVVLIPGAPHTLFNLPPARHATQGFIRDVLKP
jgi:dienelactone hydrolase